MISLKMDAKRLNPSRKVTLRRVRSENPINSNKNVLYAKNLIRSRNAYEETVLRNPAIEGATNYSGAGGFNPAYNRVKITEAENLDEFIERYTTIEACGEDYALSDEEKAELRVCFRVVLDADKVDAYKEKAAKKGFVFEYQYEDGADGQVVLGMGINSPGRHDNGKVIIDQESNETKLSQLSQMNLDEQVNKIKKPGPSLEDLKIDAKTSIASLNEIQKYQLATGLIEHFGSSWSLDKVNEIDGDTNLQPLTLIDKSGNVVGFTIAEKNGNCVELTEMFVGKDYRGKGYSKLLIPEILKECEKNRPEWGDVVYFGEFNLSSASWRSALDAGGEIVGYIQSNVTVNSEETEEGGQLRPKSFVVIVFRKEKAYFIEK